MLFVNDDFLPREGRLSERVLIAAEIEIFTPEVACLVLDRHLVKLLHREGEDRLMIVVARHAVNRISLKEKVLELDEGV